MQSHVAYCTYVHLSIHTRIYPYTFKGREEELHKEHTEKATVGYVEDAPFRKLSCPNPPEEDLRNSLGTQRYASSYFMELAVLRLALSSHVTSEHESKEWPCPQVIGAPKKTVLRRIEPSLGACT